MLSRLAQAPATTVLLAKPNAPLASLRAWTAPLESFRPQKRPPVALCAWQGPFLVKLVLTTARLAPWDLLALRGRLSAHLAPLDSKTLVLTVKMEYPAVLQLRHRRYRLASLVRQGEQALTAHLRSVSCAHWEKPKAQRGRARVQTARWAEAPPF